MATPCSVPSVARLSSFARNFALLALTGILIILFATRGALIPSGRAIAMQTGAAVHIYPRDDEIALALSAAPQPLRQDAGVYVLTSDGFVQARASRNGFTCIVNRDGPGNEKPTCYDAVGTRRILPVDLVVGKLLLDGVPQAKIEAQILSGYRSGTYHVADRPGVAYMLSDHNWDHDASTGKTMVFPPHIMFYAPYLTNKDIGSKGDFAYGLPSIGYQGPMGFIIVPCGPYCGKPLDLSM